MASLERTITREVMKENLRKKGIPKVNKHISRYYKEARGTEFKTYKNKRGQERHIEVLIKDEDRIYTKPRKSKILKGGGKNNG